MNNTLTELEIAEFQEVFQIFDRDGSGKIPITKLDPLLKYLGQAESDLEPIIKELDEKNVGYFDFPQFLQLMTRKMSKQDTVDELTEAFKLFDRNGTGLISIAEFKHLMMNLGEKLKEDEVDHMIKEVGNIKDDNINYLEFIAIILKK